MTVSLFKAGIEVHCFNNNKISSFNLESLGLILPGLNHTVSFCKCAILFLCFCRTHQFVNGQKTRSKMIGLAHMLFQVYHL